MKTTTLTEAIKQATNVKADGTIWAVRESDNYREIVVMVWDDSSEEELSEEATKEADKLINLSNWKIKGFIFETE